MSKTLDLEDRSEDVLYVLGLVVPRARELYEGMEDFEAPFLQERLEVSGEITDSNLYDVAFEEFKKYASLSVSSRQPLGMTSPEVDSVWHQFILFTKAYEAFCNDNLDGTFLHHSPYIVGESEKTISEHARNMNLAYGAVFGEAPSIWGNFEASTSPCDGCSSSDGGCSS